MNQEIWKALYASAVKWRGAPSQGTGTKTGADTDAVTNTDPDPEPWYQLSSSCQIRRNHSNTRHKNGVR